jgi:hypothetical protein
MRMLSDKIAVTDEGHAECRVPITSLPSTPTATYLISAPGVYYFPHNLTGEPGKALIQVDASHADIEADGFACIGVPGTLACIRTTSVQSCIGVFDVSFIQWHGTCIDFSTATDCYGEELWCDRCDSSGSPIGPFVFSFGARGTIDDCTATGCTGSLMGVGPDGIIEETVNVDGTGGCFYSPGPAVFEDNFALNNDGVAISIGTRGIVIGNRVLSCAGGVDSGADSTISENDISHTTGAAITLRGVGCSVDENHITECPQGIMALSGAASAVIDGNTVIGSLDGIVVDAGAPRCFITRNAVRVLPGGVAYSLAAGSSWGTIVNAIGVGDISGSGTDPGAWSNFEI